MASVPGGAEAYSAILRDEDFVKDHPWASALAGLLGGRKSKKKKGPPSKPPSLDQTVRRLFVSENLTPKLRAALDAHDAALVLSSAQVAMADRVERAPVDAVIAVGLLAEHYGVQAEAIVRSLWQKLPAPAKQQMATTAFGAIGAALPKQEGLDIAQQWVAQAADRSVRAERLWSLSPLGNDSVLDWLEDFLIHPVEPGDPPTSHWEMLVSGAKPTWARLARWLTQGAPLAWLALNTLHTYAMEDEKPSVHYQRGPRAFERPPQGELALALERLTEGDPVPRIKKQIAGIRSAWKI